MKRYSLTIPMQDNAGEFHADFPRVAEQLLAEYFSGWTKVHGVGNWRNDDGEDCREPVAVYSIDTADPDALLNLVEIAQALAVYCEQDGVYLTSQPVETFLVTRPRALEVEDESGGWH
jgi:hypothetical protein